MRLQGCVCGGGGGGGGVCVCGGRGGFVCLFGHPVSKVAVAGL